jgi:Domain of unknown function (4846)
VLAVSVGSKDLQQCADAVMRLRAEYLYAQKDFADIEFITGQGLRLNFREWAGGRRVRLSGGQLVPYRQQSPSAGPSAFSGASGSAVTSASSGPDGSSETPGSSRSSEEAASSGISGPSPTSRSAGRTDARCADRACFSAYLETVFSYCGTLSLEKQLVRVRPFSHMHIGDVLIRGGAPGHAMLVVDMAVDSQGRTLYMLAQSYMPAQDIHIVNNPLEESPGHGAPGPWYPINQKEGNQREGDRGKAGPGKEDHGQDVIQTPEYTFYTSQLRTWPGRSGGTQ